MKSYSIDFTSFSKTEELIQRLQKDKYWLYAYPRVSNTLKEDSVKQRIKMEHKNLIASNLLNLNLWVSEIQTVCVLNIPKYSKLNTPKKPT